MIPVEDIVAAAVEGIETVVHDLYASKASYPDDHKAAMRVPKGGSSCASCEYLEGTDKCNNEYFIKWNGSKQLPAPADEYCSDWYEPNKHIEAGGPGSGRHKEVTSYEVVKSPIRANRIRVVAKDGDKQVGYLLIDHDGKQAWVDGTDLDKAYRGKGYGKGMYEEAIKHLQANHPSVGTLESSDPISTDAQRVWNSLSKTYDVEKTFDHDRYMPSYTMKLNKKLEAAQEVSLEGDQKGILWNGIKITGFTGPEEEGLRAMLSRVPPELLFNVKEIKSAKELNAKHGKFDEATKTVSFNPHNFDLKQKFGKGDGSISHPELTAVHEIGHSIYRALTPEQQKEWEDISGWMEGWKPGQSIAYQEKRPGWGNAKSTWTHKAGIKFTRHYAERNPDEDFADCFAFCILGKGHQMEPAKKEFIDTYIKANVHTYPQVLIESPIRAGGPGSGRHKGPEKEKPLSARAQRAISSYVAQTKGKSQIARLNEVLVAKFVKGQTTGDNRPFDVTTSKTGIEVKTIFPGAKNDKITQHPESLARKWKEQKTLKMKNVATVAIDMRGKGLDVYIKHSLGSFRLGSMQKVESMKSLGKYLK